jgi:hypothetical protein
LATLLSRKTSAVLKEIVEMKPEREMKPWWSPTTNASATRAAYAAGEGKST